jgi:hypothetical protein
MHTHTSSSAEQGRHLVRFRVFSIVMAVLNVLALLVLLAGGWLSYSFAGSLNMGGDSNVPAYDRVSYTLLSYSYWVGDQVASGPHRPLTWALLWLLIMLGAWGYQSWRYGAGPNSTGPGGFRARWGLGVTGAALLLSLLTCLTVLPVAQSAHTAILQNGQRLQNGQSPWIEATLATLDVQERDYARCNDAGGCPLTTKSTFLNPFTAVLLLIAVAGVLAPLTPRRLKG